MQPKRLKDYFGLLADSGSENDGMIQRFQLLVWPDNPSWEYVDRPPDRVAQKRVNRIFKQTLALEPEDPVRFRFSPEAQEYFPDWIRDLETRLRSDELDPALKAHIGKYRGLMPSLALIFEIATRAAGSSEGFKAGGASDSRTVSEDNLMLAIGWCEYLESHARRIYSISRPEVEAAKTLADRILKRDIGADTPFTVRDVVQRKWKGLTTNKEVVAALKVLEEMHWVRSASKASGPSGGRPTTQYAINPKVWKRKKE